MCGITVSYVLGRTLGLKIISRFGRFLRITPQKMEKAHVFFGRAGHWGLLVGYFFPGIRHLTAVAAGAAALAYADFALFAYSGALVWSLLFVTLGVLLGGQWMKVSARIHHNMGVASAILVGCVILGVVAHWLLTRRAKQAVGA